MICNMICKVFNYAQNIFEVLPFYRDHGKTEKIALAKEGNFSHIFSTKQFTISFSYISTHVVFSIVSQFILYIYFREKLFIYYYIQSNFSNICTCNKKHFLMHYQTKIIVQNFFFKAVYAIW